MPSIQVGNRRLLKLADFLAKLPEEKFRYGHWIGEGATAKSCGTSACAMGWAASMPEFQRLGLRVDPSRVTVLDIGTGGTGEEAGRRIFALGYVDANTLFIPKEEIDDEGRYSCPENDATPKYVAKKIRKFVKAREAALAKSSKAPSAKAAK